MTAKVLEELQAEVMSAIREYIAVRPVRGMAFGNYHAIKEIVGTFPAEDRADLWSFYDAVEILRMDDFVADTYRALGSISGQFFWVVVMGYALKRGMFDYSHYHQGGNVNDYSAWMYAILTADDLTEVAKKDF